MGKPDQNRFTNLEEQRAAMKHTFDGNVCSKCGISLQYAAFSNADCRVAEEMVVFPVMTNTRDDFDAERLADQFFAKYVQDISDAAWKRNRDQLIEAGIALRTRLILLLMETRGQRDG